MVQTNRLCRISPRQQQRPQHILTSCHTMRSNPTRRSDKAHMDHQDQQRLS